MTQPVLPLPAPAAVPMPEALTPPPAEGMPAPANAPADAGRVTIVTRGGEIGSVPETELASALRMGAHVATEKQVDEARAQQTAEETFGAFATPAAALAAGARGLTLGLSDYGLVKGAEMLRGKEAGATVSENLRGLQGHAPIVSGVTELGANILPVVLSGGGAAAAEGAAAAGGKGLARTALKAVAAPIEGASALGRGAGELAAKALGAAGERSALARVGTGILKSTVGGAAEGMVYGAGSAVSEAALENHDLTAEELWASMKGAAMFGGAIGGVSAAPFALGEEAARLAGKGAKALGTGAKDLGEAIYTKVKGGVEEAKGLLSAPDAGAPGPPPESFWGKLDSKLSDFVGKVTDVQALSDEQAARSTYARKKFVQEADARFKAGPDGEPGGWAGVGRVLKDTGVIDTKAGVAANMHAPADILERIAPKIEERAAQLGDLVSNSKATVKAAHLDDAFESALKDVRGLASHKNIVASVESFRNELYDTLGLLDHEGNLLVDQHVPIQEFVRQRKGLDDLVYREAKSLDPSGRVGLMRDARRQMKKLEADALIGAGDIDAKAYAKLNREYQGLRIAQDAADDAVSRGASNRSMGASDYLAFIGGGGGLSGAALAMANKVARERGSAAASVFLHDLAQTGSLFQAARKAGVDAAGAAKGLVDAAAPALEQANAALAKLKQAQTLDAMATRAMAVKRQIGEQAQAIGKATLSTLKTASEARRIGAMRAYTSFEEYQKRRAEVEAMSDPSAVQAHLGPKLGGVANAAPSIAATLAMKAQSQAAFLNDALPPKRIDPYSVTPLVEKPREQKLTVPEMRWMRVLQVLDHPTEALAMAHDGTLSVDQAAALRQNYPEIYSSMRLAVIGSIAARDPKSGPLPRALETRLSILFDQPFRQTQTPEFMAEIQGMNAPPPPEAPPGQPPGSTRGPKKTELKLPDLSTESQERDAIQA